MEVAASVSMSSVDGVEIGCDLQVGVDATDGSLIASECKSGMVASSGIFTCARTGLLSSPPTSSMALLANSDHSFRFPCDTSRNDILMSGRCVMEVRVEEPGGLCRNCDFLLCCAS